MVIARSLRYEVHRLYAHNSLRNYTYIVVETATKHALVIDPWDGAEVWQLAEGQGWALVGIFNTHLHHDHVRGNAALNDHGVATLQGVPADWEGQWQIWATPGHTGEHRVLFLESPAWLFAGDTVFQAGVGNCKNGGDPSLLYHTIQRLLRTLPDETVVLPGHDYLRRNLEFAQQVEPTNRAVTLKLAALGEGATEEHAPLRWGEEKNLNPFLRTEEAGRWAYLNEPLASGAEDGEIIFKTLRRLRDNW